MQMGIQAGVTIKSKEITERIRNSHIKLPSCLSSFGTHPLFPDPSQNPDQFNLINKLSIVSERVDDIPLLASILLKLDLPNIIDKSNKLHGNYKGLSPGWVVTVWLVYILSQSDHRMNSVQDWIASRCSVLIAATGQEMTDKDFTDDRLADILKILHDDMIWSQIEQHISRHTIRAYNLSVDKIRLDATTAAVNHDPDEHPLFQVGRTKQNTYLPQFKLMIGTLDPLGLPIATDIVSGEKADDPLYIPIYKRIFDILEKPGVLYIGDSKMGAIETRAIIDNDRNVYLMPLAMTGDTPVLLDKILSELEAGTHQISNVFLPDDLPENLDEEPDSKKALAKGFEIIVERKYTLNGKKITWNERVCCVQSFRHAESQRKALDSRLIKAEEALQNLTPLSGRGRKQYRDEDELMFAVDKILKSRKVQGLINVTIECQESHRNIRAYKNRPARVETTIRYQIHTNRNTEKIEHARQRLGWRLYATNAHPEELSLTQVVLTYRDQYLVERNFARLKGRRLGITPLYIQRDDHACGLIRLLNNRFACYGSC